jgi:hypothetical protein
MVSTIELRKAVAAAGGSDVESYALGGVAYALTGGNPAWKSKNGDGRGAWGVSQTWHPGTPAGVQGQAAQALRILRSRGLSARVGLAPDAITEVTVLWWYPDGLAPPAFVAAVKRAVAEYCRKKGVARAGISWWWFLPVGGMALWILKGKKK